MANNMANNMAKNMAKNIDLSSSFGILLITICTIDGYIICKRSYHWIVGKQSWDFVDMKEKRKRARTEL